MATESFKVKISCPEPQTHFIKNVPTLIMTDKDGNKTVSGYQLYVGKLHRKIMTVEGRGYTSETLPERNGSSKTIVANEVDKDGNIVSTDSFEEKVITYEKSRVNEADMWRMVKTVTICALYSNGVLLGGKETFDAEDETI